MSHLPHIQTVPAGEPDVVVAEGMDITPLHEGTSFIRYYGGPIKGYYYVRVRDVGSSTIRGPLLITPIKEGVPPAGFPVTRGGSSSSAVAEDAFPSPRGGSSSSKVAEDAFPDDIGTGESSSCSAVAEDPVDIRHAITLPVREAIVSYDDIMSTKVTQLWQSNFAALHYFREIHLEDGDGHVVLERDGPHPQRHRSYL